MMTMISLCQGHDEWFRSGAFCTGYCPHGYVEVGPKYCRRYDGGCWT
ncbi:unnamed protein product, partial [Rotaria sp. Silwood1]